MRPKDDRGSCAQRFYILCACMRPRTSTTQLHARSQDVGSLPSPSPTAGPAERWAEVFSRREVSSARSGALGPSGVDRRSCVQVTAAFRCVVRRAGPADRPQPLPATVRERRSRLFERPTTLPRAPAAPHGRGASSDLVRPPQDVAGAAGRPRSRPRPWIASRSTATAAPVVGSPSRGSTTSSRSRARRRRCYRCRRRPC